MPTIKVSTSEIETGWIFEVTVSNGNSTTHRVNLSNEYYAHLSLKDINPSDNEILNQLLKLEKDIINIKNKYNE